MTTILEYIALFLQMVQDTFAAMDSIILYESGLIDVSLLDIETAIGFLLITIWGVHQILSKDSGASS